MRLGDSGMLEGKGEDTSRGCVLPPKLLKMLCVVELPRRRGFCSGSMGAGPRTSCSTVCPLGRVIRGTDEVLERKVGSEIMCLLTDFLRPPALGVVRPLLVGVVRPFSNLLPEGIRGEGCADRGRLYSLLWGEEGRILGKSSCPGAMGARRGESIASSFGDLGIIDGSGGE